MKKYYLKEDFDLNKLKKFGYTRKGGTKEEHYYWGCYEKKISKLLSDDIMVIIPFIGEFNKKELFCLYINNFNDKAESRMENPKLKRSYIQDLIKANLVEERDE